MLQIDRVTLPDRAGRDLHIRTLPTAPGPSEGGAGGGVETESPLNPAASAASPRESRQ